MRCAIDTTRPAVIDSAHCALVNYEVYFFSTPALRTRFLADPRRDCGLVTDPIARARFRPGWRSPRFDFHGRPYFFLSDSTRALFVAAPDSFATPRYEM